jgi:phage terminase small subunit
MYKTLTTKQKRFVENHVTKGMSISESVRRAGYAVKSGRSEDYGSLGCRMLKTERVADYVMKLKRKVFAKDVLSVEEKRSFLARAVRADASNPDPDLVQEMVETHGEHGSVKRVKLVSKLEAINIDNKMAGDNYSDRSGNEIVNPFLAIISLFSNQPGTLPALPALPAIEAEIVP